MAATDLVEVQCPSCRAKQDVLLTNSINVTTNPEEKEMVIAGTINYFRCRSCSYEGHIATSLFYHDMVKKFCACYIPPENLEDAEYVRHIFTRYAKISLMLPDGEEPPAEAEYVSDAHIVFSLPELSRYVLFRDRIGEVFAGDGSPSRKNTILKDQDIVS